MDVCRLIESFMGGRQSLGPGWPGPVLANSEVYEKQNQRLSAHAALFVSNATSGTGLVKKQ